MTSTSAASEYTISLPPGAMVAQYRIEHVLGRPGGFGITYLATDVNLEAQVALKEFLPRDIVGRSPDRSTVVPHSSGDGELFKYGLEQFLREARTLAKLDHPNLVRVRSFVEANSTAYLVMDYYEGQTLLEHLRKNDGRLPWRTATEVVIRLLDGLSAAHDKGILHRDVKPENIYLTRSGRPVLLDFGAAREAVMEKSQSLTTILTPGFAPIEQYGRRSKQGPWTDVYAAAAVLYQCITGERPPEATDRIVEDFLQPMSVFAPQVPTALDALVHRSLAVHAQFRPQTAREFQDLLVALEVAGDDDGGYIKTGIVPDLMQLGARTAGYADRAGYTPAYTPAQTPAYTPLSTAAAVAPAAAPAAAPAGAPVSGGAPVTPRRWPWIAVPVAIAAVVIAVLLRPREEPPPPPLLQTAANGVTVAPSTGSATTSAGTPPNTTTTPTPPTPAPTRKDAPNGGRQPDKTNDVATPKPATAPAPDPQPAEIDADSLHRALDASYDVAGNFVSAADYTQGMPLLRRIVDAAAAGLRVHPQHAALKDIQGKASRALGRAADPCKTLASARLIEAGVSNAAGATAEVTRLQGEIARGSGDAGPLRQRLQQLNAALALRRSCTP